MGHNGSGKSTLLKLIGGILKPTEGTVKVRGRIASLLELGAGMHPELTGRENVYMNGAILGMSKAELRRRFDDIVGFAELEQFIDQQVKHYSSGMFVRLGFSVAVNVEPDVLLVDEVLAVGDENFQRKCLERVRRFQRQGRTIIVVSHSADQIRQICDQVAVLDHGEVVAYDEPAKAIRVFREHLLDDELERRAHDSETEGEPSTDEQPSLAAEEPLDEASAYRAHGSRQEAKRNFQQYVVLCLFFVQLRLEVALGLLAAAVCPVGGRLVEGLLGGQAGLSVRRGLAIGLAVVGLALPLVGEEVLAEAADRLARRRRRRPRRGRARPPGRRSGASGRRRARRPRSCGPRAGSGAPGRGTCAGRSRRRRPGPRRRAGCRVDVDGDREAQPHVHARRVVLDLVVDELLELGELDDVVEAAPSARPSTCPRMAPLR